MSMIVTMIVSMIVFVSIFTVMFTHFTFMLELIHELDECGVVLEGEHDLNVRCCLFIILSFCLKRTKELLHRAASFSNNA